MTREIHEQKLKTDQENMWLFVAVTNLCQTNCLFDIKQIFRDDNGTGMTGRDNFPHPLSC